MNENRTEPKFLFLMIIKNQISNAFLYYKDKKISNLEVRNSKRGQIVVANDKHNVRFFILKIIIFNRYRYISSFFRA